MKAFMFMTKAFYSELNGFKPQSFSIKEIQKKFSGYNRKFFTTDTTA